MQINYPPSDSQIVNEELPVSRGRYSASWLNLVIMTLTLGCLLLSGNRLARALSFTNSDGSPAWSAPSAVTIKHIGPAVDGPNTPHLTPNLDCTQISYRLLASSTMQNGCFSRAAYGLFDIDDSLVIFNGSDEAISLTPYTGRQVLLPWIGTANSLVLEANSYDGVGLGFYRNLSSTLVDRPNQISQIATKQVGRSPDMILRNPDGSYLNVNPQTLAFSANGNWLVVETLAGTFVRINSTNLEMLAFAPSFGTLGSQALLQSEVAISRSGRYAAIENRSAGTFIVYDLSTCRINSVSVKYLSCESHDYWGYLDARITGLTNLSHLRFINEGLLNFTTTAGTYELAPRPSIDSMVDYLAMGDSYTSGEGAYDYMVGTDDNSNSCHLSFHSYPLLLSQQIYGGEGQSVACSGARSDDLWPLDYAKYTGQARGGGAINTLANDVITNILVNFKPGRLPQIDFIAQYQPGAVTVSIGGNDIGFASIIQNCVMPHLALRPQANDCYNSYEDRVELKNLIDRNVPRWSAVFRQIQSVSPVSHLYVIDYPQIAYPDGYCALNVRLSNSELEFAAELTDYLNYDLQQAATSAGVNFIDISEAFYGYRLCENISSNLAVNGLTAGKDAGALGLKLLGSESYHPNAFGQALIEAAILKKIKAVPAARPSVVVNNSQKLLVAPATGRQIVQLTPGNGLDKSIITRGEPINLSLDGIAYGLKAGANYRLSLDRTNDPIIAMITTSLEGNINLDFHLPETTSPGGHTIDVVGTNLAGETIDISQPLYVTTNVDDADGDGIANTNDSCPVAINSGVDLDRDGIDDVCDGFIGSVPTNLSGNTKVSGGISSTSYSSTSKAVVVARLSQPSDQQPTSPQTAPIKYNGSILQPDEPTIAKTVPQMMVSRLNLSNWLRLTKSLSLITLIFGALYLVIDWLWVVSHSRQRRAYSLS